MALYNLKSAEDSQFRITKFDSDLNPESSYLVSEEACECPQFVNRDKRCRHQKMLKLFFKGPTIRLDTGWYLDYETETWHSLDPIPDPPAEVHDGALQQADDEVQASEQEFRPTTNALAGFVRRV